MSLDVKTDELLWVQKYRPQKVADTILPELTKKSFQKFIDDNNVPNLLLAGSPGTGKTTAAKAMLEELGCDYIIINAALNRGIDTVRSEISTFASAISLAGGRKYIILDEADYLTPDAQASMRNLIETFSKNCGFIFTCNFKNRIIAPLRSRFSEVDFYIERTEKPKLAAHFFKRVLTILKNENVDFDQKVVAKVIEKYFPDFRRVLNELQKCAGNGRIDEGIFADFKQESIDELFVLLKEKNFTIMRKWCADNSDQDVNEIFRKIYDTATDKIELKSMPNFVIELADYMYKSAFVTDQEINLVAFLTSIMMETSFK
jgi:DNA polymerase III delta prime subunit